MDFFDAFSPIFVCIALFGIKLVMCSFDYALIKTMMALFCILLAAFAETHFDKQLTNNVSLRMLAIPISGILVCQALLDLQFFLNCRERTFYCLDNPYKKVWIIGNCGATIIYSICLFRWLWIMESHVSQALRMAIGTFVFYAVFLIERIGTWVLRISHD
jgi:hypothetical protein